MIGTDNSANLTLSAGTATPGRAKHALRRWAAADAIATADAAKMSAMARMVCKKKREEEEEEEERRRRRRRSRRRKGGGGRGGGGGGRRRRRRREEEEEA